MATGTPETNGGRANFALETTVRTAADKVRNTIDAAEYNHIFLPLTVLTQISDVREKRHALLVQQHVDGADKYYAQRSRR